MAVLKYGPTTLYTVRVYNDAGLRALHLRRVRSRSGRARLASPHGLIRALPAGTGPITTFPSCGGTFHEPVVRGSTRLSRRRSLTRPVRSQGDPPCRTRDARPARPAQGVRAVQAAPRGTHLRFVAHDDPDRSADRDPRRARRRGALGELQHLLDPGPRRRRGRRRPGGHGRRAQRRAGVRLEGRDAGGVLVVHRADDELAGRPVRRAGSQHDPRRRRRRHPAAAQGCRVREGGRGSRPDVGIEPRVRHRPRPVAAFVEDGAAEVDADGVADQGRHRGDHHRCDAALQDARARRVAVPGDQRQRLGHQEQVRQPVRLPPLAGRRDLPRHRRDARRQGCRRLRLRRRRQGLCAGA